MQQTWKLRLLVALALFGVAVYFVYPSYVYFTLNEEELKEVRQNKDAFAKYVPSWMPTSHIVAGLDLQGGSHMVLGVDLDKAITDKTARALDRLMATAKEEKIDVASAKQTGANLQLQDRVELVLAMPDQLEIFKEKVLKKSPDFVVISASKKGLLLELEPMLVASIRKDAVNQTIKTIVNRIDKMGVTEPTIAKSGDSQVQIQMPGYDNPEQAKLLLGRTAQLLFQMCADDTKFLKDLSGFPEGVEFIQAGMGSDMYLSFDESKLAAVKAYLQDKVPPEFNIKYGKAGMGTMMRTYTLDRKIILTGDDLVDARVTQGSPTNPRPGVSLSFSPSGAKIFADVTGSNIGKRLAIVLEDIVDSAPVINSKIPDGQALISMGGSRSNQEMLHDANQLALVLKAGALPAPVTFREERTVGPSLGKDIIEQGKTAFMVGVLAIALFMIFYYRVVGFFSIVAICFNMTFILATMSILGATITMPGVAALLLTMGMAVDSNVIINERIREELRIGKTPRSAVKAGYDAALRAIVDANTTHCIAGLVLWQFGTGPIQNFASMLLIGTVSSVLCAIFISRIFVDMMTSRGQKTLSI